MNVDELKMNYPRLHTVVAVSKTRTIEDIQRLVKKGYRDFGENKAQELIAKAPSIDGVAWHFIGHLQTNKVKEVLHYASFIHSVDSIKLLLALEKEAKKAKRKVTILMQVNLADEDTKFGLDRSEIEGFLEEAKKCEYAVLCGIMVIGPHTEDKEKIREIFREAKAMQTEIQKNIPLFRECSMGMSHDYRIALEEGATMLRIGELLFGPR